VATVVSLNCKASTQRQSVAVSESRRKFWPQSEPKSARSVILWAVYKPAQLQNLKNGVEMHTFLGDLRYGARLLGRSPGFAFVAIAALAIGIGANLTIFGFAKELLLSAPRGVADPDRVARAFTNRFSSTSQPNYEAYRDRNHSFVTLSAFRAESVNLRTEGFPEQLFGLVVSGNYFPALGLPRPLDER
jgi:hypothetical protein